MITKNSINTISLAVIPMALGAALLFLGGKIVSSVNAEEVRIIVDNKVAVLESKMKNVEDRMTKINYKMNAIDKQLYEQNIMLIKIVEKLESDD